MAISPLDNFKFPLAGVENAEIFIASGSSPICFNNSSTALSSCGSLPLVRARIWHKCNFHNASCSPSIRKALYCLSPLHLYFFHVLKLIRFFYNLKSAGFN